MSHGNEAVASSCGACLSASIALAPLLAAEGGVGDVETLVAAAPHDTIEDTDTR